MPNSIATYFRFKAVRTAALQVFIVAFAWIIFYHLSIEGLAYFTYNQDMSWVYLPAGVRLVVVILFSWVGVLGLFVGHVLTSDDVPFSQVLLLSAVSALVPKSALITMRKFFNLNPVLSSLKGCHLFILALLASCYNAIMHLCVLRYLGKYFSLFNLLPMMVGDLVGTFIIFYLAMLLLRILERSLKWSSNH